MGLNTFNWKWPWAAPNEIAVSFPIICEQTIVIASHCVGLTFPGIIEEPGSFAGNINSPIPDLGPEEEILISFAILLIDNDSCFKAWWEETIPSFEERASNLFEAIDLSLKKIKTKYSEIT